MQVTVTVQLHCVCSVSESQDTSARVSVVVPRPEAETAHDTVGLEARTTDEAVKFRPAGEVVTIMLLVPGWSSNTVTTLEPLDPTVKDDGLKAVAPPKLPAR